MAKIKLPTLGGGTGAGGIVSGEGPVVIGGGDESTVEPIAPYAISEVAEGEAQEIGLKSYVEPTDGDAPAVSAVPDDHTAEVITLPTRDVAHLDEVARTLLELRGENVEAMRRVTDAMAELRRLNTEQDAMRAMVQKHPDAVANLHARIAKLDEGFGTQIGRLAVDVKAIETVTNKFFNAHAERLDAVDVALSSRGLPVSKVATTPTLTLRPVRQLAVKARLDGTAAVLHYNPRQGRDGDDPQEITVREQPRPVSTGYMVDVPAGYIADVFVGADAVASLQGRADSELVINMRSKGPYGRQIGGGHEIARVALRKMEPMTLEVATLS